MFVNVYQLYTVTYDLELRIYDQEPCSAYFYSLVNISPTRKLNKYAFYPSAKRGVYLFYFRVHPKMAIYLLDYSFNYIKVERSSTSYIV